MLSRLHTRSVSILLTALAFGITATRAGADSFVNKRPTFRLESTKAFPGSTARLGLYVSNGVADTKAVNFTIRITGGADSVNGRLTGSSTYPGFDENMPEATEYRGLVDLPDGQEINTEGPETRIATIEVPIKQNVANGAPPIQLAVVTKFDAEGIVGLTGMSDSAGLSVHGEDEDPIPGGDRQIQGSTATIGILDTGTTIDLCPLNAYPDEWEFVQFPLSPPLTSTGHFLGEFHPGEGFSVTLKDNNAIGSFQNRDSTLR